MNGILLLKNGIGLFTCLFAVPIYTLFLYMIIKYRKLPQFNIPFYGLIFQCGILDLWYVVHQYLLFNHFLVNRFPQMFLWARVTTATIIFYGYFYIRACQAMAVLMISINRFTALIMPLRHDLIWTRKLTWMAISSQPVVAAIILIPALVGACSRDYVLIDNSTDYSYDRLTPYCVPRIGGPSALFVCFLSIVLVFLYAIMLLKACRSNVTIGHGNHIQNDQKVHRSLAIGGALISLTLVLNTCFLLLGIITLIKSGKTTPTVNAMRYVLDMLFCIINPFVLLCFGSKVRPYYWKCVKYIFCIKDRQSEESQCHNMNKLASTAGQRMTTGNNNNAVIEENL